MRMNEKTIKKQKLRRKKEQKNERKERVKEKNIKWLLQK